MPKTKTPTTVIALTSFMYGGEVILEGGEYASDDAIVRALPSRFISVNTTNAERRAARARLATTRPKLPTPEEVKAGALAHREARRAKKSEREPRPWRFLGGD